MLIFNIHTPAEKHTKMETSIEAGWPRSGTLWRTSLSINSSRCGSLYYRTLHRQWKVLCVTIIRLSASLDGCHKACRAYLLQPAYDVEYLRKPEQRRVRRSLRLKDYESHINSIVYSEADNRKKCSEKIAVKEIPHWKGFPPLAGSQRSISVSSPEVLS